MKKLLIREARVDDAQAMVDYLNTIGAESDNLTFGEEGLGVSLEEETLMLEAIQLDLNSTHLLAFKDNQLISIGSLKSSKRERSKHYALLGISVKKAYWNQGVGSQMMQALVEFAENAPDTRYIELEVRHDNVAALKLYEKMGFESLATYPAKMHVNGIDYDTRLMIKRCKKAL